MNDHSPFGNLIRNIDSGGPVKPAVKRVPLFTPLETTIGSFNGKNSCTKCGHKEDIRFMERGELCPGCRDIQIAEMESKHKAMSDKFKDSSGSQVNRKYWRCIKECNLENHFFPVCIGRIYLTSDEVNPNEEQPGCFVPWIPEPGDVVKNWRAGHPPRIVAVFDDKNQIVTVSIDEGIEGIENYYNYMLSEIEPLLGVEFEWRPE